MRQLVASFAAFRFRTENPFVMSRNEVNKITIADVYPHLSSEEQREAKEHLLRYLDVVRQIFQHITDEKPELLRELRRNARLRKRKAHK